MPQIVVSTENAVVGEEVTISVSLKNNTGICGMDFGINYDQTKLKLTEVERGTVLSNAFYMSSGTLDFMPYRTILASSDKQDFTDDGVIVEFHFEVLETAETGFTPIEISDDNQKKYVNVSDESLEIEEISGGVNISAKTETTTTKLTTSTTTTSNTTTTESTTTTSTITESTTTTTTPVTNYSLGDVNGDGYLDAKDASMILKSYAYISAGGSISDIEKMSADVNKDGLIDADDASIILSTYASFGAGVLSEYQELFDILPNMNAFSDGGYTSEEIENSSIKPFVLVEKLVVSLDEAKNNPVLKVSVNLSELGGNESFWCSGGITLKYDSRLKPVLNNVGETDVSVGEAIEYQNYIVEMNEETNCLFIAVAGSSDYASVGNIITIPFTLPDDVDYGEQYDIEIVHSGCEIFANSDDDETSRLMQAYLFTRGIDNGYIKIDDYVPTTTTESITTSTTTTTTTESTTTSTTTTTITESTTTSTMTTTTTESTTTNTTTMTTITTTEPPITTTVVPAEYKLGDVNEDNMVDAVDASLILQEYALLSTGGNGNFTDIQKSVADINDDRMTDAVDASLVLQYYAYVSTGGEKSSKEFFNKNTES